MSNESRRVGTTTLLLAEFTRLREIEEAARWMLFLGREYDRILDCDWPENENAWVGDFLGVLAEAYNDARTELARLVGGEE